MTVFEHAVCVPDPNAYTFICLFVAPQAHDGLNQRPNNWLIDSLELDPIMIYYAVL